MLFCGFVCLMSYSMDFVVVVGLVSVDLCCVMKGAIMFREVVVGDVC